MTTDKKNALESATQILIEAIEAQIEAGPGEWKMPWNAQTSLPHNALSGLSYTGGNVLVLWWSAACAGYSNPKWATYKQWEELGAQVRKGESGTHCVRWVGLSCKHDPEETCQRCGVMVPKSFVVFNAEQVDNYNPETPETISGPVGVEKYEQMFAKLGGTIRTGGGRASYNPTGDYINMPEIGEFDTAENYYSVLAHEYTHWTAAKSRLNRDLTRYSQNIEDRAFEELIAELGAALFCARAGLSVVPRIDHAQYLAEWLKCLKEHPRALWAAASSAQAAVNYLFNIIEPQPVESQSTLEVVS